MDDASDSDENGADPSNNEEVLTLIATAAKMLMDDNSNRGGTQDERVKDLSLLEKLWSGWQINFDDITYMYNEIKQMALLGQAATSVVFAGFLKEDGDKQLPVGDKTKHLTPRNIPGVLEVFLHLMVQHHRIVTLFGMWSFPRRSTQVLIVVERMTRSLADELQSDEVEKIDRVAILRDTAAGLGHLHDCGIVHRDVKPANILLNDDSTEEKLSDFGTSRRRSSSSSSTTTTLRTQQAGTCVYMAQEVRGNKYCKTTPKMDCWAFGLLTCDVMNAAERNALVDTHHADLFRAASTWASGIGDRQMRVVATACLEREGKDRPLMKAVYLHLAGAVPMCEPLVVQPAPMTREVQHDVVIESSTSDVNREVSRGIAGSRGEDDNRSGNRPGDSDEMTGRDWKEFVQVEKNYSSSCVKISVENRTQRAMELCRTHADGRLRCALRVEHRRSRWSASLATGRLTKTESDGGVFLCCTTQAPTRFVLPSLRKGSRRVWQSVRTTCTFVTLS